MPINEDIRAVLQRAIDTPKGPIGLTFAACNAKGEILAHAAAGLLSKGKTDEPMKDDSVFALFSMTKIQATLAALHLVDAGKVTLDEPLSKYLLWLGELKVQDQATGEMEEIKTPVTLRHCLTHTCGTTVGMMEPFIQKHYAAQGTSPFDGTDKWLVKTPLVAQPGSKWVYGTGLDIASAAVTALSGLKLGEYLEKYFWQPQGVKDLSFDREKRPDWEGRFVGWHVRDAQGELELSSHFPVNHKQPFHAGGLGSMGTAIDYAKSLVVLINEGKSASGEQLLKPETVRAIFTPQISQELMTRDMIPVLTMVFEGDLGLFKDKLVGFGLSTALTDDLATGRQKGAGCWSGYPNCHWNADPASGIITVICCQHVPGSGDPIVLKAFWEAEKLVYNSS